MLLQMNDLETAVLQLEQKEQERAATSDRNSESDTIGILLIALDLAMYIASVVAILMAICVVRCKFKAQGRVDVAAADTTKTTVPVSHESFSQRQTSVVPVDASPGFVDGAGGDDEKQQPAQLKKAPSRRDTISALFEDHAAYETGLRRVHSQRQQRQKRNTQMRVMARARIKSTKALAKVPIFSKLDDKTIDALVDNMRYQKFKRGTKLCRQGDIANEFFVVVSGKCAVTVARSRKKTRPAARPSTAATATAGEFTAGPAAAAKHGIDGGTCVPELKPPNLGFKWVTQVSKAKRRAMLALEPTRVATIEPLGFFGEAALLKSIAGRKGGLGALSILRSATVTVDTETAQILSLRSTDFLKLLETGVLDQRILDGFLAVNRERVEATAQKQAERRAAIEAAREQGLEVASDAEEEEEEDGGEEDDDGGEEEMNLQTMGGLEDLQSMLDGAAQRPPASTDSGLMLRPPPDKKPATKDGEASGRQKKKLEDRLHDLHQMERLAIGRQKTRVQAAIQMQQRRLEAGRAAADIPGPEPAVASSERNSEEMGAAEKQQREAATKRANKSKIAMLEQLRDLQVKLLNASDNTEKARIQAAIQGQMRRLGGHGRGRTATVVGRRVGSGISL